MAHFARLDENNVVTEVIVVDNKELIVPSTGEEDEILGIAFCKKLFGGNWVQTSYNNRIRKNYACIGYTYDKQLDAFIPPQPYPSWILNNETAHWEPPIPKPEITPEQSELEKEYKWNEESGQWDLVDAIINS